MNCLIDAHALIWAADNPAALSDAGTRALQNSGNVLWISAGTVWEIVIKAGLGKLRLNLPFHEWVRSCMDNLNARLVPITIEHAARQSALPLHHRDPFDRLLVAQALVEGYEIVSSDAALDAYSVARVW